MLEKLFHLKENSTDIKKELLAGFTTFITMAYIIFVNPQMMSSAGMELGAVFVGTCLAAALACIAMGLYANWPIGLAPGMGLNAFFTFTVVGEMGYSWEIALGAVFIAGILFMIMSITRMRQWMLESIPMNLRIAMGCGVGLFIGFIGLKSGGIIVANEATLLSLGDIMQSETLLAVMSFLVIAVLSIRNIPGAMLIGILTVTILGILMGMIEYRGIVSSPPEFASVFLKLDILGALDLAMISVIMSFLFVNLFDTAGTLLGVANQAKLVDDEGNIKGMDKALKVDSTSGVQAGGRTGLTAITVGCLFLLAIFFAPLASMIPAYATSGALIYVAILMLSGLERLDWSKMSELLPALVM